MKDKSSLKQLMENGTFYFAKLALKGIDNAPVLEKNHQKLTEEETCIFHRDISQGDQYVEILHRFICEGVAHKNPAPVVRFADGEYAFYAKKLTCNGLYQQAESVKAIEKALPQHLHALRILGQIGKLAPLIHPGNARGSGKGYLSFLPKRKSDKIALIFLDLLYNNNINLTKYNYIPFYVVYSYLISTKFATIVDQRKLCILSSECQTDLCKAWFARLSSKPKIVFIQIPESYVATQWQNIRTDTMDKIPSDTEICLVGAGIGSLPVCVDVATTFSVPAIDAGHILNMMNNREDKSNGPRLYTIKKG